MQYFLLFSVCSCSIFCYLVCAHAVFSVLFQSLAMAARERGQGADDEDSDRSNLPLPGRVPLFSSCLFLIVHVSHCCW